MKKINAILFTAFILLYSGCSTTSDPSAGETKTALTVTVDKSYSTDATTDYLIVNNANGDVVGFKAFETNSTFEIKCQPSAAGDSVSVTLVTINATARRLTTYFGIPTGDNWILKRPVASDVPAPAGKISVTINSIENTNLPNMVLMGNKRQSFESSGDAVTSSTAFINGTANDFYLTYAKFGGTVKQKYLPGLSSGDEITIDDSEMPTADRVLSIAVPANNYWNIEVLGREVGQPESESGYWLQDASGVTSDGLSIQTGYPDRLGQFTTTLSITAPGRSYLNEYYKKGSIPVPPTWPDESSFTILKSSMGELEFSASANTRFHSAFWENSEDGDIQWTTYSTGTHEKLGVLPSSLLATNPELGITRFAYVKTSFYTATNYSLSDYLSRQFRNQPDPADVEYSRVTVYRK